MMTISEDVCISLFYSKTLPSCFVAVVPSEDRTVRRSAGTEAPGLNEIGATFPPTVPVSFGTTNSTVITAQTGTTALIPCVVLNIGDGMVSVGNKTRHAVVFFKVLISTGGNEPVKFITGCFIVRMAIANCQTVIRSDIGG